ncbi:hypothetical protein D9M68_771530 [compost metagenome]
MLCRPQAHGEHRQQVVETEYRVGQASHQPGMVVTGVGKGYGRGEEQGEGEQGFAQVHGGLLTISSGSTQAARSMPWRSIKAMISSRP